MDSPSPLFMRLYVYTTDKNGGGGEHAVHVCSNFYIRKYVYYHLNYNLPHPISILGIALDWNDILYVNECVTCVYRRCCLSKMDELL